jgi:hypothetical protein
VVIMMHISVHVQLFALLCKYIHVPPFFKTNLILRTQVLNYVIRELYISHSLFAQEKVNVKSSPYTPWRRVGVEV